MLKLKKHNLTELIGCSVYEVEELERIQKSFDFDLYQIPYNSLDRRFSESGWIDRLTSRGIQVHARSVFLQGLLLMKREDKPDWLNGYSRGLDEWFDYVSISGQSALNLCLDFVFQNPNLTGVVVGVDTACQLEEIHNYLTSSRESFDFIPSEVSLLLCDPRLWGAAAASYKEQGL
jgi:aryl-alcohol dehydrogenase-like predicted oxidoreductase